MVGLFGVCVAAIRSMDVFPILCGQRENAARRRCVFGGRAQLLATVFGGDNKMEVRLFVTDVRRSESVSRSFSFKLNVGVLSFKWLLCAQGNSNFVDEWKLFDDGARRTSFTRDRVGGLCHCPRG